MSFANPLFLAALAVAALPILIHLLTRDRVQHVAFSTLRFFAKGAKLVVRRKKNQELLLLLLRMALLALLALAFARPFLAKKVVDSRHEFSTARVIVADVSGSMRRAGLPDQLQKKAADAAGSLHDGQDAGALITFADAPDVVATFNEPLSAVRAAAQALTPGYGGTNIAAALRRANDLLREVRANHKEIVLISDLQRAGWNYFKGDWKLGADVKLTIDAVKPNAAGGAVAIMEISAPNNLILDKQPATIAVRVANFSDRPRNQVKIALNLGGHEVDTQQINVRQHGRVAVRFRHIFEATGDNPGSVVVGSDATAPGSTVYFNAHVIPRIPVLLIDGHPSADPQADAAFFLGKALVPVPDSPFSVTNVNADKVTATDIAANTVVVFADVGQVAPEIPGALKALLDRGGGLFFLPGDAVTAETFNAQFGDVAPCRLRQILQARPGDGATAESFSRIDFQSPIFSVFSAPHHGDLSLPKFTQYWETTDTQSSTVLARFGDDRPAILTRQIGRGSSILLASGIEPAWNDLARQSIFLPLIHQTVRYLAVQTARSTTFTCGDSLPVPAGDTLQDPAGQAVKTAGKGSFLSTLPGFYLALAPGGKTDATFAVNPNLAEGNPATVTPEEMVAALQRAPEEIGGAFTDANAPAAAAPQNAGFWWYLVWLILFLSLIELVLGNTTLRH